MKDKLLGASPVLKELRRVHQPSVLDHEHLLHSPGQALARVGDRAAAHRAALLPVGRLHPALSLAPLLPAAPPLAEFESALGRRHQGHNRGLPRLQEREQDREEPQNDGVHDRHNRPVL